MAQRIPHPPVCAPSRRMAGESIHLDRRRIAPRIRFPLAVEPVVADMAAAETADPRLAIDQALGDILRSVISVTGGHRAFLMISRDQRSVEIAATHRIRPGEILHAAVTRMSQAINRAFSDREMTLADRRGDLLAAPDARQTASPAWICSPFTAAMRISGVLCVERQAKGKRLTELDLEIVQALTDQAATALAAVRTHDALSRLSAALGQDALGDTVGIPTLNA